MPSVEARALAWRLGSKVSKEVSKEDFLFINLQAKYGSVIFLQHGDHLSPAIVLFHGGLGTPVATQLQPYLPS